MNTYAMGLYGLGVMGRSLALNFIRRGIPTAVYSKAEGERTAFAAAHPAGQWTVCESPAELVSALARPRVVFLMITAGAPVDQVLEELLGLLEPGDVVIDGGNSRYQDTVRRCERAAKEGVEFLGVGVSGGEKGALEGPCLMAGGSRKGWERCRESLEAIAARASDGGLCCGYVGPGGAGHYVKMVHNGIEYAVMQQLADVYGLMRDGMGCSAARAAEIFEGWRTGPLASYLVDITAAVLRKEEDGTPLVDRVLDVARQKGTGCWSVVEAAERGVYVPCIDEALFTRYHSQRREDRQKCAQKLPCTAAPSAPALTAPELEQALYAAILCAYVQGLELIGEASRASGWDVDLAFVVELWRGGCIIRSALLGRLASALREGTEPLVLAPPLREPLSQAEPCLRRTVLAGAARGIPLPALGAALLYYDQSRTARMSVNLVQALRDCFGAHTYERTDRSGTFHTDWES